MASTFLCLLVVLLCFSHPICMTAIPTTRTRILIHDYQGHRLSGNNLLAKEGFELHSINGRRMDAELNDYPGSGANNRHTPKSQPWRGCPDC